MCKDKRSLAIDENWRHHQMVLFDWSSGTSSEHTDNEVMVMGHGKFRESVAITTWYLWWKRHKLTHEEPVQSAIQVSSYVRALTTNHLIASSPKAKLKHSGWVLPPQHYVELNIDAAFDPVSIQGDSGAVLRDCNGKFIAAWNKKIEVCIHLLPRKPCKWDTSWT